MPRKKKNKDEGEKKKGSKLLTVVVILAILLLWLAIFAILIKLDIGGLGTMLRPSLKNVPILNTLLPKLPQEIESWENNYPFTTMEEAIVRIQELEAEKAQQEDEIAAYLAKIEELEKEIARLKVFEEDVLNFEERKKRFDQMVVFNPEAPDLEEYKKFYEEINPETAEEIYQVVLEKLQYDKGIQEQAEILRTMKPSQAAAALEESTADIGLIAEWLLAMKKTESAAILNKMDPLFVAKILRKMADMNEEALNDIMSQMDY